MVNIGINHRRGALTTSSKVNLTIYVKVNNALTTCINYNNSRILRFSTLTISVIPNKEG